MERSYRRRLLDEHLAAFAPLLRGRVLEIGAGRRGRRGLFRPPPEGVARWVCVDRRAEPGPDARSDASRLAFRDGSFDAVVCLEVLEYADEPIAVLREIARVLRPRGMLCLSIPFLHRWDADHDLWRATPEGLRRWLAASGFAVERSIAQGGALATAANILKFAVWNGIGPAPLRAVAALVSLPVLELLVRLDAAATRRRPVLGTFATGYLVLARRE